VEEGVEGVEGEDEDAGFARGKGQHLSLFVLG
jgi:hypothetical protein